MNTCFTAEKLLSTRDYSVSSFPAKKSRTARGKLLFTYACGIVVLTTSRKKSKITFKPLFLRVEILKGRIKLKTEKY